MRRVMIIGQPGSGKSTLARTLGEITYLPVAHIDHIHWKSGWVERDRAEKGRLCAEVHARPAWIFEGGHSRTWPERLERADTLIWLDFPLWLRVWRVVKRTLLHYGRTRPDLPEGCPERFDPEFFRWIWNTRKTGRAGCQALYTTCPDQKTKVRLSSPAQVRAYLSGLREAVAVGNLGIPHR